MSPAALQRARERLIAAADVGTLREAVSLAEPLAGRVGWIKVGKRLFTAEGPESVRRLRELGFRIFLDLKFHDIPATVASAAVEAMGLGVDLFNVHASGGRRMMEETRRRVQREARVRGVSPPKMIAVTVLTSLEASDLAELGLEPDPALWVRRWAALARQAGLDGVVCSPREAATLRSAHGEEFWLVTPGIRPQGAAEDDQRRTMSAGEAVAQGATHLVVGRPLTAAPDPAAAAEQMVSEIAAAC